jgi:hypothetical protein
MVTIENVLKLHLQLELAGLPVISVQSDGTIQYDRKLTKTEQTAADDIVSNYDPTPEPVITQEEKIADLQAQIEKLQNIQGVVTTKMIAAELMTATDVSAVSVGASEILITK